MLENVLNFLKSDVNSITEDIYVRLELLKIDGDQFKHFI